MTIGIPGIVSLAGVFALMPSLAWSMDVEQLVPGGFFAESSAWNGETATGISSETTAFDFRINRQVLSESQTYGLSTHSSDSSIAFFTPRFAGLQGSVGYRPDALEAGNDAQLGVNWSLDLTADTQIAAASRYELDNGNFDIGAKYAQGPWEVQLTYGNSESENEQDEIESLAFSAGYTVGPGISFTGVLGAAGRSSTAEENKSAEDPNRDDFWVVTGVKIRF